jgi:cytochrome c553
MTMSRRLLAVLLTPPVAAAAAEDGKAFFEAKVRPVLIKHCYECHSVESGKSKGGLLLDSREGLRKGGDTGPAVVPGDPGGSLLLAAVKHEQDMEMPPKKPRLPAAVISDLEAWIKAGAVDPRDAGKAASGSPGATGRNFWSYRKPVMPPSAEAGIDGMILARLNEQGLKPAPEAGPVILLRRLHFDLTGLPPTPEEAASFKAADMEARVDALLASREFGVRWGRHWLDVARFAESNGRESNLTFPHAWRYRDYVIDAVNADMPYDRFITEQVAGDLLPAKDDVERARLLAATGFLAIGAKGLNEQNKAQFAADVADEQLDAVTRAVLASSIACARCHDHKTDPFTMEDYYALAGIFKSTKTFYGNWIDSENNNHGHLIRLPQLPGQVIVGKTLPEERVRQLKADLAKLNADEKAQQEYITRARAKGRDISDEAHRLLSNALRILWTRGGVEGALEAVDDKGRPLPLCMGVKDAEVMDSPLYERGEISHPRGTVPRGFPKIWDSEVQVPKDQSGRLELARWLTGRDNPLAARVMVNRIWHHLFGTGLVRTVDDFGATGEAPSHPELLDYLALRFMEGGWSVKKMIKEIVMTETYRRAGLREPGRASKVDPDNRLLSHASRRRLDAEVIRDAMLSVSGLLDLSRRPGSLVAELDGQSVALIGFNAKLPPDLDGSRHRSVYLPVIRDHLPDVLEQFDVANPSLVTGGRDVTNVPLQALYVMNGPFVLEQARALARRVQKAQDPVQEAFQLCFNRSPDEQEIRMVRKFLEDAGDHEQGLAAFCQALLASAEFRLVD